MTNFHIYLRLNSILLCREIGIADSITQNLYHSKEMTYVMCYVCDWI